MLTDKLSDLILACTEDIFKTVQEDEADLNTKVNSLCFSIEYYAAFCATAIRQLAEASDTGDVSNITLDFLLEAVLDKRAAELGAKVSGEPVGETEAPNSDAAL